MLQNDRKMHNQTDKANTAKKRITATENNLPSDEGDDQQVLAVINDI